MDFVNVGRKQTSVFSRSQINLMSFSEKQARAKAEQIFTRFGELIHDACAGEGVEESFLAGFTGVEAGIDSKGKIKPEATRFEPGVYKDLISLREKGYCFVGGKKLNNYSGVRREQIKDASDAAIRALATSYSFSQIMGWHCINNLKCTIAELRDPNKHFGYTVKLLKIVGGNYMKHGDLEAVLHIWNTGSANGKTYHEDYVENALKVKKHYEAILKEHNYKYPKSSISTAAPDGNSAANPIKTKLPNEAGSSAQLPTPKAQPSNPSAEFVAEDKKVEAPPPAGFMKRALVWLAGFGLVPPSISTVIETIKGYAADGTFNLKDALASAGEVARFIFPYLVYLSIAFIVFWGIKELFKQVTMLWQMYLTARPDMHNVCIIPHGKPYEAGEWQKDSDECEVKQNELEIWNDRVNPKPDHPKPPPPPPQRKSPSGSF